jgi:NIL domain
MSLIAVLLLIAGAVVVGLACQVIGRSSASYEWEIGAVGALYGALLGFGFAQDATPIIPLLSGAVCGGLLVLVFRGFGSPIPAMRKVESGVAATTCTRVVRFGFAPELIQDPLIYRMRTRCGVTTRFVQAEITGNEGWVELWISGSEPAVEAALGVAREGGIHVMASKEPGPALVAA